MKIKIGKRLWAEDDATHGLDDHESLGDAWFRLVGSKLRMAETLFLLDYGDLFEYVKRVDIRIYFVREWYDGSEIYEAEMIK